MLTCSLTRHTTLEVIENGTYEATKLAMLRIFYDRGVPRLLISDREKAFMALARDYESREGRLEAASDEEWLYGWDKSHKRMDLEQTYGIVFRFQLAESAENMGLAERLDKTITHSILTLRQIDLKISAVETLVKGLQCMLNKRALSMVDGEPITPNMLLTGFDIDMQPDYNQSKVDKKFINTRADIQAQTKR